MNAANVDDGDEEADDNDAVLNPVCPKLSDILEGFQVLHYYMAPNLSGEDIH